MPMKLTPLTRPDLVEDEINSKYMYNSDIHREDLQVFVELTENNLAPVDFGIDANNKIHIYDNHDGVAQKPMYVGSKRQFLYKVFKVQNDSLKININVEEFKTGWDPTKYFVFRNGYLLNSSLLRIIIPAIDNIYAYKEIYSIAKFKKGDRVDVFYIESEDYLQHIPFNRDVYLCIRKQYATMNQQTLFKIPYPYDNYPRGQKMFFVCDQQGHYLDNRNDYQISEDDEYITLKPDLIQISAYTSYLIFTFPYVKQDWEDEEGADEDTMSGNKSGVDYEISYSILSPENLSGKINFFPIFNQYDIDKDGRNMLLFGNSTFIEKERYNIISNGTIQLKDEIDIKHSPYCQYVMVIFKEQQTFDIENMEFAIEVHQVEITEDGQQAIYIPKVDVQKVSFLAFNNSLNFDQKDRYQWKQEINRMDITEPEDFLDKGEVMTFIFYKPLKPKLMRDKEIYFKKMQFDIEDDSGQVKIPSNLYNDIEFNPSNLILFLNGTYLQPDRYSIVDNVISMVSPIDDGFDDTKTLVGIYLVAYKPNYWEEVDGPYKYTDMKEDHDWIIFDEMYATPYIPDSVTADIVGGGLEYLRGDLTYWFFDNNTISFEYKGGYFNEDGKDNRGTLTGLFTYSRGTFNPDRDGYGRISGLLELESKNPNIGVGFNNDSLVLEFYYQNRFLSDSINHSYPFYFECDFEWFTSSNDDIRVDMYFGSTSATNGALLDIYWGYPNGTRITSIALNAENRVDTNKPNRDSYNFITAYQPVKNITVGIGITDTEIKAFFYAPIDRNGRTALQERTVYGYLPNPFYITAYMSDPPYWDNVLSVRVTTNFGKTDWKYPELAARYY